MQQERAKSSKEGQSENQSGKLPGEQSVRCGMGQGLQGHCSRKIVQEGR